MAGDVESWEPPIKVVCGKCGIMNEEDTEFVGIEEDFQGADILEFICPTCMMVRKSRRYG